jgi:hypothetical protein
MSGPPAGHMQLAPSIPAVHISRGAPVHTAGCKPASNRCTWSTWPPGWGCQAHGAAAPCGGGSPCSARGLCQAAAPAAAAVVPRTAPLPPCRRAAGGPARQRGPRQRCRCCRWRGRCHLLLRCRCCWALRHCAAAAAPCCPPAGRCAACLLCRAPPPLPAWLHAHWPLQRDYCRCCWAAGRLRTRWLGAVPPAAVSRVRFIGSTSLRDRQQPQGQAAASGTGSSLRAVKEPQAHRQRSHVAAGAEAWVATH